MLLIILAPCFILAGIIILGKHLSSLTYLKNTSGTLVGFEQNKVTKEFHPILSFHFNKDKYFFKNTNTTPFPRHTLGSRHTIYFESPPKKVEVMNVPLKATLASPSKNEWLPWILMALGVFCVAYFSQITGFYFLFVASLIGLRYFYIWAKANLFFANAYDTSNETIPARFPLSETFSEETFKQMDVLDLRALRLCREQWLTKQQSNGLVFITLATLCLVTCYFTAPPAEVASAPKAPVVKKALSIEQVLDARSVEAAEEQYGSEGADRKIYCTWIDITSCYFTYLALEGEEADSLINKSLNLLILNVGLIFLALSMICFFARSIFSQHDFVTTPKKEEPLPLAIAVPEANHIPVEPIEDIKISKK